MVGKGGWRGVGEQRTVIVKLPTTYTEAQILDYVAERWQVPKHAPWIQSSTTVQNAIQMAMHDTRDTQRGFYTSNTPFETKTITSASLNRKRGEYCFESTVSDKRTH